MTKLLALILLLSPTLLMAQGSPPSPAALQAKERPSLAERLGFSATDKILIVNCDDVGNSHAANVAVIDGMENGLITSGTIMVPCPWVPEIFAYAKAHPEKDFGLHLTHTAEWKGYKWGPVASKSEVPGLVDPQGYLYPDIMAVYKNATPEQAYIEAKAQVKKALDAGVDVTHLDSHMGALQYAEPYFQIYRRLANEFNLPIRMGSQEVLAAAGGAHQRGQLDTDGVIYTDYLIHGGREKGEAITAYWKRQLSGLKPGVTELYIHAAAEGEEIKHITNSWRDRAEEYRMFTRDPEIKKMLADQGVKLIGWRPLRELQRKERAARKKAN